MTELPTPPLPPQPSPEVTSLEQLQEWLTAVKARVMWQSETPTGPLDCYLINGQTLYIQFHDFAGRVKDWEAYASLGQHSDDKGLLGKVELILTIPTMPFLSAQKAKEPVAPCV